MEKFNDENKTLLVTCFKSGSLSMNLDFNGTQPVSIRASFTVSGNDRPHPDLPEEKGQRLHVSLYAVVRLANPVACALWFRGSMRDLEMGSSVTLVMRQKKRGRTLLRPLF